jgi:hypothetical protein
MAPGVRRVVASSDFIRRVSLGCPAGRNTRTTLTCSITIQWPLPNVDSQKTFLPRGHSPIANTRTVPQLTTKG